jgi:hypothetical protein
MTAPLAIPLIVVRRPSDSLACARRREPVTVGVPLPQGACHDAQSWRLLDKDDHPLLLQTRVLDRWTDGSVRWLLVDSQVDVPESAGTSLRLCADGDSTAAQPAPELRVSRTGDALSIDTGPAHFGLRPGPRCPFDRIEVGGRSVLDLDGTGVEVVDRAGRAARATVTRVAVIEEGPVRVRVGLDLKLPGGSLKDLALYARLDFYVGLSAVRIALRVRNPKAARHPGGFWDLGDPGSMFVKDLSLMFGLPSDAAVSSVQASLENGESMADFRLPFALYQDSSGGENWKSTNHLNRERRVPLQFRGYRARSGSEERSGLRTTPIVSMRSHASTIGVAIPYFWQNFPRAIEADQDRLTVRFWPRQYSDLHELQGGEQKTHVCFVSFGDDMVTTQPLEWCRSPIHVRAEPTWYFSAPATPWIGPDDPDHAALVQVAVDGPHSFGNKREVIDEYGWRHFGDIYGDHEAVRHTGPTPLVSHYNNQYDPVAGFLYQYFRTGDLRWWTMADELAAHVIDIDVYHTDRDKWAYNHGLFWHTCHYCDADTSSHRTYPRSARAVVHGGGPSPDHTYTTGLMLHYFLTGDEASRDTVVGLAQFVLDADDGAKTMLRWLSRAPTGYATASGSYSYHGPGRGPANSLNALLDGHRLTGEHRFLEKAEEIIRRVVHPEEDVAQHRLDDPEHRWFYLMFLQSLGKYLWRKGELGHLDNMYGYGRASLLLYADWMVAHERPYLDTPEKLEYPTETWAAHEVRKSDVLCLASLCAQGSTRERLLERSNFFFRCATETLRPMPTRTLARPVIVLLSSGLVLPGMGLTRSLAWPPPSKPVPTFGAFETFRPQKEIAKRRLKVLVTSIGLLLLAGGVLILFRPFAA